MCPKARLNAMLLSNSKMFSHCTDLRPAQLIHAVRNNIACLLVMGSNLTRAAHFPFTFSG